MIPGVRILLVALAAVSLALQGCGARVVGQGDYEIRGSLVDAETRAPVSRADVYVHAFNDGLGRQTSLEREDATTFIIRMPRPDVRLRVSDATGRYQLYETTLDVPSGGLDHVVQLVPTHHVLVTGRLLSARGTAGPGSASVKGSGRTRCSPSGRTAEDQRGCGWTRGRTGRSGPASRARVSMSSCWTLPCTPTRRSSISPAFATRRSSGTSAWLATDCRRWDGGPRTTLRAPRCVHTFSLSMSLRHD